MRLSARAVTLLALASASSSVVDGFVPLSAPSVVRSASAGATALSMAQIPILDDWKIIRGGAVVGTVSNHPSIDDGDVITTSPLADPDASQDGVIVVTKSGSKYRLGKGIASVKKNNGMAKPSGGGDGGGGFFGRKRAAPPAKASAPSPSPPPPKKAPAVAKKAPPAPKPAAAAAKAAVDPEKELADRLRQAKIDYGLSGQTVGKNGKYLLVGKARRTTSGKSQIFNAYKSDGKGLPEGSQLTIKLSPNIDALSRENRNYDKIRGGIIKGQFVNKIEFLKQSESPGFEKQAALIIETGKKDLKQVLSARMGKGLSGKAMRNAAACAAQCVQAMHANGLVWTDLKTENFVVLPDSVDMAGMKGIDLESAIAKGGNPVDYSPEACPPEFAKAFLNGYGADFVLDYSYDIWSFGMLLFEISTGKPYFAGKSPSAITKILNIGEFNANLNGVKDAKLRDLIGQCLQSDPKKRPGIAQILLHPYFVTTGIGPFSF